MTRLAVLSLAALAVAGTLARSGSGSTEAARFSGNLCATVSKAALSELKVPGPCVQATTHRVQPTPLGAVQETVYQARWGSLGSISAPTHHIEVGLIHLEGSGAALAFAAKYFRGKVLSNGALVRSKPLTSAYGDTNACHNPPTGDCASWEVMALAGHYGLTLTYKGSAKFVAADNPQDPSVDDANDRAQEQQDKNSVIAFANSITGAL